MNGRIVILTVGTVLSAILTVWARERELRRQLYVFKPLTMVFILSMASILGRSHSSPYFYWILIGLIFCLIGDVFLMFPERFVHGLIGFLMGHVFYILAFTADVGFTLSLYFGIPLLLYGMGIYSILFQGLGKMKLPVLAYVVVIVTMAWQAWERWFRIQQSAALFASVGALLFILSDSILAWNRFRKEFRYEYAFNLSTYFVAQWLIAYSVRQ